MKVRGALIRYLLAAVLLGFTVAFLLRHPGIFDSIREISLPALLALLALSMLILVVLGLQFRFTVSIFRLNLPAREWIGLTAINTMFNYYLPARGGLLVRGAYLKRKFNFPFSQYASLVASSQLLVLANAAALGMVTLGLSSLHVRDEGFLRLLLIFLVIFAGSVLGYRLIPIAGNTEFASGPGWFKQLLRNFADGFLCWKRQARAKLYFSLITLALMFLWSLRLFGCFLALSAPVGFNKIMLIQALLSASLVVSITPGNLGVKEGITAIISNLVSVDPSIAILASLLDRALAVLITFGMGLVFSHILLREVS